MQTDVEAMVKDRIIFHGRGWCFTPLSFFDIGSNAAVRQALSRLHKQKLIRRLTQGVYDYPQVHAVLGEIPPDLHEVAKVIAEKNGVQIQPAGAQAANLVGLTSQVPARIVYLTEGPSRKVRIGKQEIVFKKTTHKVMSSAGTPEGLVIQALKNLGKEHIDQSVCSKVANFLKNSNESEIRKNMKYAPAWIRILVFQIMGIQL